MSIHEIEPQLNGHGLRIGVVQSRFNEPICEGLRSGCLAGLRQMQVQDTDITYITVPGALEIPLALQTMAQSGHFDALIALGAVIRGETYHFEIVSNES
ncbi:MAG TPA: 6,7-dimethyl-8-ribityllumazine synthase, partial [Rugosibacter sp.]|nr:6,7-dimethyl-8-ribityllumazine synthase [Rugosibacter sp.]